MQFLTAEQTPTALRYSVWLDTTKTGPDGTTAPDPAFVRDYTWSPVPKGWTGTSLNGVTYTDWAAYCAAEAKLLAAAGLAAMNPPAPVPTPLAVQGTTF